MYITIHFPLRYKNGGGRTCTNQQFHEYILFSISTLFILSNLSFTFSCASGAYVYVSRALALIDILRSYQYLTMRSNHLIVEDKSQNLPH